MLLGWSDEFIGVICTFKMHFTLGEVSNEGGNCCMGVAKHELLQQWFPSPLEGQGESSGSATKPSVCECKSSVDDSYAQYLIYSSFDKYKIRK